MRPTVADLLDIKPPRPLDGTSLLPVLLEGHPLPGRSLFWEYRGQQAARRGPWKLVRNVRNWTQSEVVLEGVALYNLAGDLDESNNLASEYPERVDDMFAALEAWKEDVTNGATVQPEK